MFSNTQVPHKGEKHKGAVWHTFLLYDPLSININVAMGEMLI